MSPSRQDTRRTGSIDIEAIAPGVAFATGWLALYLPTYIGLAGDAWRRPEHAHAPFTLAIAAFALMSQLSAERPALASRVEQALGLAALFLSFAMLTVGRTSEAAVIETASQLPAAVGCAIFMFGFRGAVRLAFPIGMTAFLIVWPGWLLDAFTFPLKLLVSESVSGALYMLGLPVAQTGTVISAGPYQLLVAEACSGLNSLMALAAIAAVYLYAARRDDWRISAIVLLAVVPIAIGANVARVATLVIITYYLGYDAGQSFLHEGAGLLMFSVALALVFAIDVAAAFAFMDRGRRQ